MPSDELRENVAHHMAYVHESVESSTVSFRQQERRNVYTTPKSYLELIQLYKKLLEKNTQEVEQMKARLEMGLIKLRSSASQVADMQVQLKEEAIVVEMKKKETDVLLVQVGQESAIADEQAELGAIEAEKVAAIQQEVSAFAAQCNADLAAAEPAVIKAAEALNNLDKGSLTELKSMTSPAPIVLATVNAVQYMMAPKGQLNKTKTAWAEAKKMMASVDKFLESLLSFDKDNLLPENKAKVRGITGTPEAPNPEFNFPSVKRVSLAAAGLCDWVVNILIYHDIYLDVEPKRKLLQEAETKLSDANKKLQVVSETVAALNARKEGLQQQLVEATEEKNKLVEKAEKTAKRLNLAERLVNGLKDENERWGNNVEDLTARKY
jgi:dynein heavy chain